MINENMSVSFRWPFDRRKIALSKKNNLYIQCFKYNKDIHIHINTKPFTYKSRIHVMPTRLQIPTKKLEILVIIDTIYPSRYLYNFISSKFKTISTYSACFYNNYPHWKIPNSYLPPPHHNQFHTLVRCPHDNALKSP